MTNSKQLIITLLVLSALSMSACSEKETVSISSTVFENSLDSDASSSDTPASSVTVKEETADYKYPYEEVMPSIDYFTPAESLKQSDLNAETGSAASKESLSTDEILKELSDRITYNYDGNYGTIEIFTDSGSYEMVDIGSFLKTNNCTFESLTWENNIRIEFFDGNPYLNAVATFNTDPHTSGPEVTVGVTATMDKEDFSIGTLNLYSYDASISDNNDYQTATEQEVPFYYCYKDIDHDGVKDKIVLSSALPDYDFNGSFEELMNDWTHVVNARVFGGSYAYTDPATQTFSDSACLTYTFACSHTGNGQLFVTTVDDEDYLVYTDFWSGQGESTYSYKVFFGNENGQYIVDSYSTSCNSENKPEDIDAFWSSLDSWINDSSILLIATDIDSEPSILYSTCDETVSPNLFLDMKR